MKIMKKFVFMFIVFALVFSCKKAPPPASPPPPPPPPPKTELVAFIQNIGDLSEVKNLEQGKSVEVSINPEKVLSTATTATVERFKSEWTYDELVPVNKKIPLTIIWPAERPSLLILDYNDLEGYYSSKDKFLVLDPKPEYVVKVGDKTYWVSKDRKLWKTW